MRALKKEEEEEAMIKQEEEEEESEEETSEEESEDSEDDTALRMKPVFIEKYVSFFFLNSVCLCGFVYFNVCFESRFIVTTRF